MEPQSIETIQVWLDGFASAQLLFDRNTLVAVNAYAKSILPTLKEGSRASAVFGDAVEDYRSFSGSGSMLFSVDFGDIHMDAKVTKWEAYQLVELIPTQEAISDAAISAIAEGIMNPMTTIMALTPKLLPLLEKQGDPLTMERTSQLNRSLYALMRAANNLRLSGAGENLTSMHKKRVNLCRWMEELTKRLEPLMKQVERRFSVQLPAKDCMCDIDGERLERAILNLISNAVKFTQPGGLVEIGVKKTAPGRVRITIRDDGCGIPAYQMGIVFQRKESRPLIPDSRYGIGLGMPLVKRIVQAHGGNILIESQEGKGTAVHLSLETFPNTENQCLHSTIKRPDYSGGFDHVLMELADVLPSGVFDTRGID